jgi:hypothetical protein
MKLFDLDREICKQEEAVNRRLEQCLEIQEVFLSLVVSCELEKFRYFREFLLLFRGC